MIAFKFFVFAKVFEMACFMKRPSELYFRRPTNILGKHAGKRHAGIIR